MTTITILPQIGNGAEKSYRAIAGAVHSEGGTVGEALDALTSKLGEPEGTTLVIVQRGRPDPYFSLAQQQRLEELMARWGQARDGKTQFTKVEQAELDALVDAELRAAKDRAAAMVNGIAP
jgi:hypothetical protein